LEYEIKCTDIYDSTVFWCVALWAKKRQISVQKEAYPKQMQ